MERLVEHGEAAGQRDDLGDRQLHHRTRVGVRRVEHGDAVRRRRGEVHLVGADGEDPDARGARAVAEHTRAVSSVLDRMPRSWNPRSSSMSSDSSSAPVRVTTSIPAASRTLVATGWTFSRRSARMTPRMVHETRPSPRAPRRRVPAQAGMTDARPARAATRSAPRWAGGDAPDRPARPRSATVSRPRAVAREGPLR